jgi:hypothetical protein
MLTHNLARIMTALVRRAFLAFIFVLFAQNTFSAQKLSSQAQISLITISPGSDLYSAFGHSTLWILDTEQNIDRVYNYGTFNFDQPNFYLNFVKGHLDYTLSVYSFEEQYLSTQYEGRGLSQQVLNLDSGQKQRLFDFLEWNSLPENSHYLYDFYLDNCSSRFRDVLQTICGKELVFDKTISTPYSFRDWMNICLIPHPWSALFMNIGLGAPADRKTDYLTQMYLPINLKLGISTATNHAKPLVKRENELLDPIEIEHTNGSIAIWISTGIIMLISFILFFSTKRILIIERIFDVSLFSFVTLLGLALALLWLCTDHWVCASNTDLLWANPLSFVYLLLLTKLKSKNLIYYISVSTLVLSFSYFTFGFLLSEKPVFILFPFIIALQIRVIYHLFILKN